VIVAHIVTPGGPPLFASWLASLALFGGALGALVWSRPSRRRPALLAISGAGLVASAVLLVVQPSVPLRPGYDIRLIDAPQPSSPVMLRVCGVDAVISAAPVPGPGRLLLVSVDGHQAAEVRANTVTLPMRTGEHRVVAELITSDHRAFVPPITASTTVTVTRPGPIQAAPTCTP
jgi:hypothetical protein